MTSVAQEPNAQDIRFEPRVLSAPSEPMVLPGNRWRMADAATAMCILTTIVIAGNLDQMPRGLDAFLAIRLSLKNVVLLGGFGMAWPMILAICGLYAPARLRLGLGEWPRLWLAAGIGGALAMIFPLTSRSGAVRLEHVLLFTLAIAPASALLRSIARGVRRGATRTGQRRQVLIVGSGPLAQRMYCQLQSDPLCGSEAIGFVDSVPQTATDDWCVTRDEITRNRCRAASVPMAHLGGVSELEQILMHRVVDDVFIGLPIKSHYEEIQQALLACARVGVPAKYPADLFRTSLGVAIGDGRVDTPVLSLAVAPDDYRLVIKRGGDIFGASLLLVLLAPVMLAIAIAIKLTSAGPVFFAQERFGYMKRRFRMFKFRTMVANADQLQAKLEGRNEAVGPAFKIRQDPRITRIGAFLRRSSLDELPQIWHVLTGEMSLVGPRPMAVRDVNLFAEPWLMKRFSVRPGLTCLWQVSGRSNLAFDRWIALDLEYIDNWSLTQDAVILMKTVPAVILGTGAS